MGEYEQAFALFEELKQTCSVHISHIGSLIAACGTNWQADRALELFWTMRGRYQVDPSPTCLNSLLVALVRSGRYDLLEPTMDRAYEAYQLCVWPKTVGYIIRSAVQLEVPFRTHTHTNAHASTALWRGAGFGVQQGVPGDGGGEVAADGGHEEGAGAGRRTRGQAGRPPRRQRAAPDGLKQKKTENK